MKFQSAWISGSFCYPSGKCKIVLIAAHSWDISPEFPGWRNVLLTGIDCWHTINYHDCLWWIISRGDNRNWTVAFPVFVHSSWKAHGSYSLKFFVVKNHVRNHSLSNCSLLDSHFARSCSTCPSQRSKYIEGVVGRLKNNLPGTVAMRHTIAQHKAVKIVHFIKLFIEMKVRWP